MNEKILAIIIQVIVFLICFVFTYFYFNKTKEYIQVNLDRFLIFSYNCSISYRLQKYIENKIPITPESFRYIFSHERENLLKHYRNLTQYNGIVRYDTLVPFHSNGLSKQQVDYREYFMPQNVNIKHYSSYVKHGDLYENDQNLFKIIPSSEKVDINIQKKIYINIWDNSWKTNATFT